MKKLPPSINLIASVAVACTVALVVPLVASGLPTITASLPGSAAVPADWLRTARIGTPWGYASQPGTWEASVDQAVTDGVTCILDWSAFADTYQGRVLDNHTTPLAGMRDRAEYVHTNHPGVHLIYYFGPLEMQTTDADMDQDGVADPGKHTAYVDHPGWLQVSRDGRKAVFYGSQPGMPFWVDPTSEDVWLCPNDADYVENVVLPWMREAAGTGIDGIWLDVPFLISEFGDGWTAQWPCHCDTCRTKFQAETGYAMPATVNWDDPAWRAFVAWRYQQIHDFLGRVNTALKSVNPACQLIIETSTGLGPQSTTTGCHTLDLFDVSDTTGHEHCGPSTAVPYYEWLYQAAHFAWYRGTDGPNRPSWMLSYADTADVFRLHGATLTAYNLNPYVSADEGMAGIPDEALRRQMYTWLSDHQDAFYTPAFTPHANVALVYSRSTLDYLDRGDYDVETFRPEFMGLAMMLLESHVPSRVLSDTDLGALAGYEVVILPHVAAMSATQAQALRSYVSAGGTLIATGETSLYDEQGVQLSDYQLAEAFGVSAGSAQEGQVYTNIYGAGRVVFAPALPGNDYFNAAQPGWGTGNPAQAEQVRAAFLSDVWALAGVDSLLTTNAPRGVTFQLFARPGELSLRAVNFAGVAAGVAVPTPQAGISVTLRLPTGTTLQSATRLDFMGTPVTQTYTQPDANRVSFTFDLTNQTTLRFHTVTYNVYLPLALKS